MKRPVAIGVGVLVTLGVLLVAIGILRPFGLPDPHVSIQAHHIQHFFFVAAGCLLGIALARALARDNGPAQRRDAWLIPAILAPVLIMVAMWPTSYPYIEARPLLHSVDHAVFIALAALSTFAAYRFARPIGWLLGALTSAMTLATALGFGVAPGPSPLIAAEAARTAAAGPADGAAVYAQNCMACHQAEGAGLPGVFPPLAGNVPTLLAADGGREYLTLVLLYGLQGAITVDGQTFNGAMPAWGHLSDDQLAAVLNHVGTDWGNQLPSGQGPFAGAELAAARAEVLTPQQVYALRQELSTP